MKEMSNVKFNQDSYGQQLIVTGLLELSEKEGYTPHQACEILEMLLDKIENGIFFNLVEIEKEDETNE